MGKKRGGTTVEWTGYLRPLEHEVAEPITYFARVGDEAVRLNDWLGQTIRITFLKEKACCHCGRKIKKTYNNGYCFPCFRDLAENDLCIVKPHLCHYHEGTCRDDVFGDQHCMVPHYVYLALSSDVKVGITRKTNAFKRWVDQGAVAAVPIAEVPTRKAAGELELHLSQYIADKTDWRKMLKNEVAERDLWQVREEIREKVPEMFLPYWLEETQMYRFTYPQLDRPEKMKSLGLDKQEEITGRLVGIKAQYLLLDHGVFHMRKHTGYKVTLAV
jgi:hypothetical protein